MKKKRLIYAALFLSVLLAEILIALFVKDAFVRPYVGDMLVTLLIGCLVRIFLPTGVRGLPLYVFLFAAAVEGLQYIDIVRLLGLEHSALISTLVGRSFAWADVACYAVGCVALWGVQRLLCRIT